MSDLSTKPKASYAPVYAAALYPDLAELFRNHGYALAVHGSLQRDMDLVAIPWVEGPSLPTAVLEDVIKTFDIQLIGDLTRKIHNRMVQTISVGFGQCAIDLSFMPVSSD